MDKFLKLGLSEEVLKSLVGLGIEEPTDIQEIHCSSKNAIKSERRLRKVGSWNIRWFCWALPSLSRPSVKWAFGAFSLYC